MIMKYVKSGTFTNEQLSVAETITEISDTLQIAIKNIENVSGDNQDLTTALKNLNEALSYLPYINKKVKIALAYVPEDVKEKNHL